MGSAASELSDLVVVTSDNPRSEDPLAIINDAMVGVQRHSTRAIVEPLSLIHISTNRPNWTPC